MIHIVQSKSVYGRNGLCGRLVYIRPNLQTYSSMTPFFRRTGTSVKFSGKIFQKNILNLFQMM